MKPIELTAECACGHLIVFRFDMDCSCRRAPLSVKCEKCGIEYSPRFTFGVSMVHPSFLDFSLQFSASRKADRRLFEPLILFPPEVLL